MPDKAEVGQLVLFCYHCIFVIWLDVVGREANVWFIQVNGDVEVVVFSVVPKIFFPFSKLSNLDLGEVMAAKRGVTSMLNTLTCWFDYSLRMDLHLLYKLKLSVYRHNFVGSES